MLNFSGNVWGGACCHIIAIAFLFLRHTRNSHHTDLLTAVPDKSTTPSSTQLVAQPPLSANLSVNTPHTQLKPVQPDRQLMKQLRSWSFEDALNFELSGDMMHTLGSETLDSRVAAATPETLAMVYKAVQGAKNSQQLIVKFKPETWAAIKSGSMQIMKNAQTGVQRATAVSTATGKIAENATVVQQTAVSAASIIGAAVTVAHLVAGWDNAKSLKRIEKGLDVIHQR